MKKFAYAFFVTLLLVAASDARAQCPRIKFAPGSTGAVINGKAGANKHACYELHARAGQRMSAHLTSPDKRAHFFIRPDEYDADFLDGADGVTDWEGVLDSAGGASDYTIVVEASRAGATFTLEVNIPPAKRAAGPSPRAAAAPCGNFSGTYQTDYGPLRLTRTGDQVRGTYTSERGGPGTVWGTVRGDVLTGRWKEPGSAGSFRFELNTDGRSFTGVFKTDGAPDASGEWGGQCADDNH